MYPTLALFANIKVSGKSCVNNFSHICGAWAEHDPVCL